MSSGRVRLAIIGIQDSFLTGEPDVTYFIKKFNRHTKFALEVLNTAFFQTNIDFGSWVNVVIPKTGQLIRTIYVKLILPALSVGGYTNSIGNAIIEYADLVIGGQTIERITGEYMQIYDQIFISDSQQDALVYMVGTTPNGLGPASAVSSGAVLPAYGWYPRTFVVPLPFYFLKNNALSIPLCSLTRQEVEIRIKFRQFKDVIDGGYRLMSNVSTTDILWSPITLPAGVIPSDLPFVNVTWLPYSSLFALIQLPGTTYAPVTSNIYYYTSTNIFDNLTHISTSNVGSITCISQNNTGITLVLTGYSSISPYNKAVYSQFGPSGPFTVIPSQLDINSGFLYVDTDGTSFLSINYNFDFNIYTLFNFRYINNSFTIVNELAVHSDFINGPFIVSLTWSPSLNAYIVGTKSGIMYTYKIGAGVLNQIVGVIGPYTAYSPVYGQIYNNSPVACSNTAISNVYLSSFDGGITWVDPTQLGTTSISYSPSFNIFFTLQVIPFSTSYSSNTYWLYNSTIPSSFNTYSIGTPNTTTTQEYPVALSAFQASLPVEYVFLSGEEVKYIQSAKIDYVITQLQLADTILPAATDILSAYRLYFINPVKELFFVIQDSSVLATNDYFNYTNTTTGGDQLINLELQFNGEDIISRTVADALYLGKVQFLNNHTRIPNMSIYNYSFASEPENYLPTGQVNMSRIMDQSIWMWLTPSDFVRNIRVYAVSYNILRVQNGLAGVLFIDNNFI